MKRFVLIAIAMSALHAWAGDSSPVGLWKSIDDHTGKAKSLIRISEADDQFSGKVEKLFRGPGEEPDPKCDKCSDARKDQPIIGMTILSGLRKHGDEYSGGEILDPANGKLYKSKMSVVDDGKKLNVRGYIGAPLFGRTQTWVREE